MTESEVVCACGCGAVLSELTAIRGARYKYGHKARVETVTAAATTAARPSPSKSKGGRSGKTQSYSFDRIADMAQENIGLIRQEISAKESEIKSIQEKLDALDVQLLKYEKLLESLSALK